MTGYDFTRDQPGASEFADLNQSTVAILDQSTVAILDGKIFPVALNQSTVAILDQSTVAILDGGLPKSFGHGTMVAGLVHLVAPTARILPLKAFRADGTANLSDIVRAIRYAADNGATVLSMSFTFSTLSPDLQSAIQYAVSKGVICVASAGNNGSERAYYPAALEQVIGVGSTNYSDLRSPFSNYDNSAVTAAPGEAIVTTYPGNNYAAAWGTSFSAPLVAGAVALFDTVRPKLKIDDLDDVMSSGVAIHQNMGARLDLVKALTYCLHMN
jgi:subtilisin family serine protease